MIGMRGEKANTVFAFSPHVPHALVRASLPRLGAAAADDRSGLGEHQGGPTGGEVRHVGAGRLTLRGADPGLEVLCTVEQQFSDEVVGSRAAVSGSEDLPRLEATEAGNALGQRRMDTGVMLVERGRILRLTVGDH